MLRISVAFTQKEDCPEGALQEASKTGLPGGSEGDIQVLTSTFDIGPPQEDSENMPPEKWKELIEFVGLGLLYSHDWSGDITYHITGEFTDLNQD